MYSQLSRFMQPVGLVQSCDSGPTRITTVKQVFVSFTNGGILSGYPSLLALHLSGTPNLKTGTNPLAVNSKSTIYL